MTPWRFTLLSTLLRGRVRWDDPEDTLRRWTRWEARLGLLCGLVFGFLGAYHGPPLVYLAAPFCAASVILFFARD